MIKFEQVYKDYPVSGSRLRALHPTDLAITAGEVFGLVGHSGAGKSTLLRLINRLEAPSGGRVWVDGQEITALDSRALRRFRQQVGMIFQHFNLLSCKTVAQNIALPLQLAGMRDPATIARRVDELLARVAIADQADKYPAQLSGGQKQRVGIARALALKPKILLCDEATSALDPQTTVQVLRLLREINLELGLTIVLITHEMDVIRRVCDRVAVMDGGRVVEQGEVMQVFLHPQHPTTQRFVRENEHLDEDSLHNDFAQVEGRILRLTFQGEATYAPTLSQLASATGVQYSILAGRIDRIQNRPCGQLTVALRGDNLAAALAWLDKADLHLEVLR